MAGFLEGLGLGALVGVALSEGLKMLVGATVKRHSERGTDRRKLFRDDAAQLQGRVLPLVEKALAYYARPSHLGKKDAAQIRMDLKVFSELWQVLSARLKEAGEKELPSPALIRFRQALTSSIDVTRPTGLPLEDPTVQRIHSAMAVVMDELSKVKYGAV